MKAFSLSGLATCSYNGCNAVVGSAISRAMRICSQGWRVRPNIAMQK